MWCYFSIHPTRALIHNPFCVDSKISRFFVAVAAASSGSMWGVGKGPGRPSPPGGVGRCAGSWMQWLLSGLCRPHLAYQRGGGGGGTELTAGEHCCVVKWQALHFGGAAAAPLWRQITGPPSPSPLLSSAESVLSWLPAYSSFQASHLFPLPTETSALCKATARLK